MNLLIILKRLLTSPPSGRVLSLSKEGIKGRRNPQPPTDPILNLHTPYPSHLPDHIISTVNLTYPRQHSIQNSIVVKIGDQANIKISYYHLYLN